VDLSQGLGPGHPEAWWAADETVAEVAAKNRRATAETMAGWALRKGAAVITLPPAALGSYGKLLGEDRQDVQDIHPEDLARIRTALDLQTQNLVAEDMERLARLGPQPEEEEEN